MSKPSTMFDYCELERRIAADEYRWKSVGDSRLRFHGTETGRTTSSKPNLVKLDRRTGEPVASRAEELTAPDPELIRLFHEMRDHDHDWQFQMKNGTTVTVHARRPTPGGHNALVAAQTLPPGQDPYGPPPQNHPPGVPIPGPAPAPGYYWNHSTGCWMTGRGVAWQPGQGALGSQNYGLKSIAYPAANSWVRPTAPTDPDPATPVAPAVSATFRPDDQVLNRDSGATGRVIREIREGVYEVDWNGRQTCITAGRLVLVSRARALHGCMNCLEPNEYQDGPFTCGKCRMEARQRE